MGITEDLNEIKDILKEKDVEKEKRFKIPFGKKVGKTQKKKNYITLVKLMENNSLDFKKVRIENQTFWEEGIPRLASAGYVYIWKKNPFIFLPNWSVEPMNNKTFKPFNKEKDFEESLEEGRNVVGYKVLLETMEVNATKQKPGVPNFLKWGIGLVIGGIILYALLSGGV